MSASRISAIALCAASCSGLLSVAKAVDSIPVPISYYTFDGTTGDNTVTDSVRGSAGLGTIYESSPDGIGGWNNGVQSSGTFVPGKNGNAMKFDGAAANITYVAAPLAAGTTQYSVSAWVYANTFTSWGTIVKNWGEFQVGALHLGLLESSPNWSNFVGTTALDQDGNPIAYGVYDSANVNFNQWVNLVTTFDSSTNQTYLYVDGAQVGSASADGTVATNFILMSMGVKLNDAQTGPAAINTGRLDGFIDDLTFWNVALTPGQVSSVFTGSQIPVPEPSTYALGAIATGVMAFVARRRKARRA